MVARPAFGQPAFINLLRRAVARGQAFDMLADALQHVRPPAFKQQAAAANSLLVHRIAKRVTLHGGSVAVKPSAVVSNAVNGAVRTASG